MRNNNKFLLAVAYCGGCNPDIDREELVRRLARETGLTVKSLRGAERTADIILLVNGCPRGCLDPVLNPEPSGRIVVVAGLNINGWPVEPEYLTEVLARKVMEIAQVERGL